VRDMTKAPTQADTGAGYSDPSTEAPQHLEQAYVYEVDGEFENALRECELAIQLAPDWAEAHNLRGIVLEELGRKEEAIAAYREAVRLDPAFREARENLSEAKAEPREETKTVETERSGARWEAEKNAASWVYAWLYLSPFLTVPCFVFQLFDLHSRSTVGEQVWAAIVPLIFHVPLLLMSFGVGSLFVRRHMQQALLLIALRAGMAAVSLNLGQFPEGGLCGPGLFCLGNGTLWLFTSLWGLTQVARGDCWLMRWKGEDGELPRPWAVSPDVPASSAASVPATMPTGAPVSLIPAASSLFEAPAEPNTTFEDGLRQLRIGKQTDAIACFLAAFQDGPPHLRHRALAELEKLGEVETF
jgi:tetratricopeptide (TPR) repeat protein